jgi:hypothetical protein
MKASVAASHDGDISGAFADGISRAGDVRSKPQR